MAPKATKLAQIEKEVASLETKDDGALQKMLKAWSKFKSLNTLDTEQLTLVDAHIEKIKAEKTKKVVKKVGEDVGKASEHGKTAEEKIDAGLVLMHEGRQELKEANTHMHAAQSNVQELYENI